MSSLDIQFMLADVLRQGFPSTTADRFTQMRYVSAVQNLGAARQSGILWRTIGGVMFQPFTLVSCIL